MKIVKENGEGGGESAMPRVSLLILDENRVHLAGNDLPGTPLKPNEAPEQALARLGAIHPRLLGTHYDGETLRLIYLADGPAETPLAEAYKRPLTRVAAHALAIALTGAHAVSRPRVAAYGLVLEGERLLLCRLSPYEGSGGSWTVPGGGLEFGEHPEQACVREVREETGYDVRLDGLLEVQSEVHPVALGPMHSLRFVYRAHIAGGDLTVEAEGTTDLVAWHTESEARRLPLVPLAARVVDLAFPPERGRPVR